MLVTTPPQPPTIPVVTIWVHGTRPDSLAPKSLHSVINPITKVLFLCKMGLHKATNLDRQYYLYTLAKKLCSQEQTLFSWNDMYLFGWSGALRSEARKNAAKKLYQEIMQITLLYTKKHGTAPVFQLIGHSHGCNVILHMVDILEKEKSDIIIKKAILLACPVQYNTQQFATSKVLKRVYAIHSHTDTVQWIDPQGLHYLYDNRKTFHVKDIYKLCTSPFFSKRHFDPHPRIIHANIRWNNKALWQTDYDPIDAVWLQPIKRLLSYLDRIKPSRGLMHMEFTLLPFVTKLSYIINVLDKCFAKSKQSLDKKNLDITIAL